MGVLPLQFKEGENASTLGLTGQEVFDVRGLSSAIRPRSEVTLAAVAPDGTRKTFQAVVRLDSAVEVNYYRNGGILPTVLRSLLKPE
jgi:aconitate hydratase